jgi:hypothetical protein
MGDRSLKAAVAIVRMMISWGMEQHPTRIKFLFISHTGNEIPFMEVEWSLEEETKFIVPCGRSCG